MTVYIDVKLYLTCQYLMALNNEWLYRLAHWGSNEMADILQMTYSNVFSWINMVMFWLRLHSSWLLRIAVKNKSSLVQVNAIIGLSPNRWQAIAWTNVSLWLHSIYRKAINSLWPSDAIWRQRSGSTLAQVMVCCLTAPNHYLNQCWLIISEV